MADPETRIQRRERHAQDVEESQKQLRENIAKTNKLLDDSDKMLKRHRLECDDAEN
jgi:hypothetical protein